MLYNYCFLLAGMYEGYRKDLNNYRNYYSEHHTRWKSNNGFLDDYKFTKQAMVIGFTVLTLVIVALSFFIVILWRKTNQVRH